MPRNKKPDYAEMEGQEASTPAALDINQDDKIEGNVAFICSHCSSRIEGEVVWLSHDSETRTYWPQEGPALDVVESNYPYDRACADMLVRGKVSH